jgi:hypothetical protein
MRQYFHSTLANQNGSTLVITILVVLALTAVSITAMQSSTLDLNIAINDKFHKMIAYATDGATQMATELVEQNIEERPGFGTGPGIMRQQVVVDTGNFYLNEEDANCALNDPSATNRDVMAPNLGGGTVYLRIYGNTGLSTGSALQIAAGDKGRGKGLAGGGAQITYDIRGLGQGHGASESRVLVRWVHLI